jgi:DNA-binding protein H-NS
MTRHTLAEIEANIKEHEQQVTQLKAAAAKVRADEIGVIVQNLRLKISEYGITAKELGFTDRSGPSGRRAVARPTYRGPNGELWIAGTRGRKPRWLAEALASGKSRSDFAA